MRSFRCSSPHPHLSHLDRRISRRGSPTVPLEVINPATEKPIAHLERAGVEETDRAVAAAQAAFPAWRAVKPADRVRLLRRIATAVEEHGEELARLETANVGKPLGDSRWEMGTVADVFHFYSGA